ncbi:MAG: alginate export family protein, partial [Candidatus Omnitrophica bacterium]|nr:alginate export family protein [Candidatus Omnitrophota bacterium]
KPHEHSLYLRLKDKETWRDPADANGRHDWDGPHVDYLFLTLDVNPVWVQAGRRFYQVGQGIAYSNVHDGVELLVSGAVWSLMGFVSRTLPHESNVDLSVPGGKKSGRTFYGVEGKYLGIPNHGVYGYVLFQRDDNDEDPDDLTRDYDYQSEYFGLGSEGKLLENLHYAAELILETGDSLTSAAPQQTGDIMAWAMDASVTYDVQLPMQPTLYAEYAFGSGDSDRSNVTDTVNGNLAGRDTNFLYFGYLPTGYALSPRLSNLRMFKAGMALKPLERIPMFKELSCSVDFYRYMKEEAAGGVFDLDAADADKDLGYEVDLTLNWQILSDLALAVEYGRFEPGDAYPRATNDAAEYFAVSITSTF